MKSCLSAKTFTVIYTTADVSATRLNQIFMNIYIVGDADFDSLISPELTAVRIDQIEKGCSAEGYLIESILSRNSKIFI